MPERSGKPAFFKKRVFREYRTNFSAFAPNAVKLFVLAAAILALLAAFPQPGVCSTAEDSAILDNVKKYEELTSTKDAETSGRCLDRAARDWDAIYARLWQSKGMDAELKKTVDAAVDSRIEKTGYWDQIKGLWDEKVIGRMLEDAVNDSLTAFAPKYRDFIGEVTGPYSDALAGLLTEFAQETIAVRREAARSLPGYEALLGRSLQPALARIQGDYKTPSVGAPITPGAFSEGAAGVAVLALRKVLQKRLAANLVKQFLGAAGKKLILVFEGPLGWGIGVALIGHDVYSIGKEIKDVPEKMKSGIFNSMKQLYSSDAPQLAWKDGLREEVQSRIKEVRDLIGGEFDAAVKELMSCPSYRAAASKVDREQQDELAKKLYVLRSRTSIGLCRLSDKLAPFLLQVGARELSCIQEAIKSLGIDVTGGWLSVAPHKMCILVEIPSDRLIKYEPNTENLSVLLWASDLPQAVRETALNLDSHTMNRVRGLERNTQVEVLRGGSPDKVAARLDRRNGESNPPASSGNWYESAQVWGISIIGPLVGADKVRSVFDIGVAAAAVLIGLFILLFLRKLGLFRLVGWLVRRKKPPDQGAVGELPEMRAILETRLQGSPQTEGLGTPPGRVLFTTSTVPPIQDCVVLGLVSGSAVLSRHMVADLGASLKNTVGGELKTYTLLLDSALSLAMERLANNAAALGADGVFGIQLACPRISSGSAEVLLIGTAYRACPAKDGNAAQVTKA